MTSEPARHGAHTEFQAIAEKDVVEKDGGWTSTSGDPWLRIEPVERIGSSPWIHIRYSTSLLDDPVRPLIRFRTMQGEEIVDIMDGAVCGSARWIGRVPDGTVEVAISPTDRPGPFAFRIESILGLTKAQVVMRALRRRPNIAIVAIGAFIINARDVSRKWLQTALCPTPVSSYHSWVREYFRDPEPRGIDGPRSGTAAPSIRLIVDVAGCDAATLHRTLRSLQAQTSPAWTLHLMGAGARNLSEICGTAHADNRVVALDEDTPELPSAGDDLCALIKAGDTLPPHAVAMIAQAAAAETSPLAIYGDEDSQTSDGTLHSPVFRPDWSPILQEMSPYLGPMVLVRRSALQSRLRGIRDLLDERVYSDALQALPAGSVKHLRRVLYRRIRDVTDGHHPPRQSATVAQEYPRVAIVIPTRDRADLLSKCIDGLTRRTDYPDFEVVIVDNGSTEPAALDLLQKLRARRNYTVIERPGDFNYSSLCNDGSKKSDAPVLVFLNNDIVIPDARWLKALACWTLRPDVGAVGAKLLYPNWPFRNRLQHVGVAIGLFGLAGHTDYYGWNGDPGYLGVNAVPHEVSAVTGACLAVTREKFDAVGGFDAENLPIDLNDIDLCLKLGKHGWRSVFTPDAVLYHAESASRGKTVYAAARYAAERNFFISEWHHVMRDDPYFHPGFSRYSKRIRLA